MPPRIIALGLIKRSATPARTSVIRRAVNGPRTLTRMLIYLLLTLRLMHDARSLYTIASPHHGYRTGLDGPNHSLCNCLFIFTYVGMGSTHSLHKSFSPQQVFSFKSPFLITYSTDAIVYYVFFIFLV